MWWRGREWTLRTRWSRPVDNKKFVRTCPLKRQQHEIFDLWFFPHQSNPPGALIHNLKCFRIRFQIHQHSQNSSLIHRCVVEFSNMDVTGLGKYIPPRSHFLFDCSLKGQESFSNFLKFDSLLFQMTGRYNMERQDLTHRKFWLAVTYSVPSFDLTPKIIAARFDPPLRYLCIFTARFDLSPHIHRRVLTYHSCNRGTWC